MRPSSITLALALTVSGCRTPAEPDSTVRDTPTPAPSEPAPPPPSSDQVTDDNVFAREKLDPLAAELQLAPGIVDHALRLGPLFKRTFDARNPRGTRTFSRAVFLKTHGCAKGTFTVASDLPAEYRKGLFATPGEQHDAWVRASSDTEPTTSDFDQSTVGVAIKVLNVPGDHVMPSEANATTQDFLLQNHHVFFADNADEFFKLFTGGLPQARKQQLEQILDHDMKKDVSAVHEHTFWSTVPYKFGDDGHARYKLVPCRMPPRLEPLPTNGPNTKNYLRDRWLRDIAAKGLCFNLQVQLRRPNDPLDNATVDWPERASRPTTVGTLKVEPTEGPRSFEATCEHFSFQPWHALTAHRPVGSLNEVRGLIYKRLSDHRRNFKNGQPIQEPN